MPLEASAGPQLAVLDAEDGILQLIRIALEKMGVTVRGFRTAKEFRSAAPFAEWAAVLSEVRLPDASGLALMREVHGHAPSVRFVLMSAESPVSTVVEAMKEGAADFLSKPFRLSELHEALRPALEGTPAGHGTDEVGPSTDAVGCSAAWRDLLSKAARVAETNATALIRGETGSGKEVLARVIASQGLRARGPFVAVNCSAMPENLVESELFGHVRGAFTGATLSRPGLFEEANGGTLFLDEIGTMPFPAQAKILRVLEERRVRRVGDNRSIPVDLRVIAATNVGMEAAVARHEFREDLYYRLAVVTLQIPPLRERRDDIPVLARHFLRKLALPGEKPRRLSESALHLLLGYPFPGNVRELKHALEQAVVFSTGEELRPADFTALAARAEMIPGHRDSSGIFGPAEPVTPQRLLEALRSTGGNRVEAARTLKISRSTLYRLLRQISESETSSSLSEGLVVS